VARTVGFDIDVGDRGATTTPVKAATALERLAARLDEAGRAAAKTTAASAVAGDALDELGDEARDAAGDVDELGDQMGQAAGGAGRLAAAIDTTRARHADLIRQLDRTGDVSLIPEIRGEASMLRTLSRMRGELSETRSGLRGLADDLASGTRGLGSALSGGVSGVASLGPGLGVAAAAAAPLIGAAVTEGIMLGVGAAGIAAGIAGAFRAPEVKAAWSSFAETGGVVLEQAGQRFRAPLIEALDDADKRLRGLDLAGAIVPLADAVGPLEQGLMGLAERAMPGIRTAAEAAVKPVEALADELPDVGEAISGALSAASVGADGAARAMQDLLTAAEGAVVSVGAIAGGLGKVYELADAAGMTGLLGMAGDAEGLHGTLVRLNDEVHRTDPAAQEAVAGLQAMEDAFADLAQRAESTRATISGSNQTLFDSNLALAEGYDRLKGSVASHGTTLDINTEAGRSNIQILEQMIDAAGRSADAEYAKAIATGNASGAEAAANATRAAAIAQIRDHAAAVGMDAGQVNALIAQLAALPRGTLDFAYRVNVSVYGDVNAARAVMAAAGGNTAGMTASQINNAQRIINKGRSAGGPVRAGETYLVGEDRPELFVPKTDGVILPRVPTRSDPTPWGTPASSSSAPVVLRIDSGGSRLDDLVVDIVRAAVDAAGGDVQYALGRSG